MKKVTKPIPSNFLDDAETFKLAVECTDLGVWEYNVATGQLIWSRKLYEIVGVELGTPVNFTDFHKFIHPEDLNMVLSLIHISEPTRPY